MNLRATSPKSHGQYHRVAAQSKSSDLAQFKIRCRGKSFMNFDESCIKKALSL
jgi:hypothetical protein